MLAFSLLWPSNSLQIFKMIIYFVHKEHVFQIRMEMIVYSLNDVPFDKININLCLSLYITFLFFWQYWGWKLGEHSTTKWHAQLETLWDHRRNQVQRCSVMCLTSPMHIRCEQETMSCHPPCLYPSVSWDNWGGEQEKGGIPRPICSGAPRACDWMKTTLSPALLKSLPAGQKLFPMTAKTWPAFRSVYWRNLNGNQEES